MSTIPVCCTAEAALPVLESLLNQAHEYHARLVPDPSHYFTIITEIKNGEAFIPADPSLPPLQPFTSPFLGKSVQEVAKCLPKTRYFAVIDDRSHDETALLVKQNLRHPDRPLQTVRVAFQVSEIEMVSMNVGSGGIEELQDAANRAGGVYAAKSREQSPQADAAAPRKALASVRQQNDS
ncbi:hypothetical protein S40288_11548 [Stachybotrys chartarum IBT 40288]|nr:hypothetical protein S40288_11548 [Stachybotrys chartarum IBT 40288]